MNLSNSTFKSDFQTEAFIDGIEQFLRRQAVFKFEVMRHLDSF